MWKSVRIGIMVLTVIAVHSQSHSSDTSISTHAEGGKANRPSVGETGLPWASGTVEDVDVANRYVILKHGPIDNLHMDAMTMAFNVKDHRILVKLKTGDKVTFTAINIDDVPTIMALKIVK
jgi:Cu/Ag efflux protein CusF